MFAYFEVKGKQFIAKKGDILKNCPHFQGQVGDIVFTERVFGVNDSVGSPNGVYLPGAKVELKIVKQGKTKKIRVVSFKPQKRHERWKGFRKQYTNLEVIDITWSTLK